MGYNARNDEIRDNVTRMQREWEAQRNALATVRRFNATLSAKGCVWFWPKIAAPPSHQNITGSLSTATVAALWWTWTCALSRVIPKLQSVLRLAMCIARAAMAMAARAFSRWRSILRSKRGVVGKFEPARGHHEIANYQTRHYD